MISRSDIPKTAKLNIALRQRVLRMGYADPDFASAMWHECSRDALFFISLFVWILETRDKGDWELGRKYGKSKELPFITRSYQDDLVAEALESWGHKDIIVWKSREMGATLIFLALVLWDCLFHEMTQIGIVSDTEKKAADSEDKSSLLSMLMYMVEKLPKWLKGNVTHLVSKNSVAFENNSTITGYPATGNFIRGGRKSVLIMDEFHAFPTGEDYAALDASVDATHCRVFISTVNRGRGCSGAFYDLCNDPTHNGHIITLDWWQDKDKAIGLYHSDRIGTTARYSLVIDDAGFWDKHVQPDGEYSHPKKKGQTYPFVLDGKKRSLYFDWRCTRPGATPASVEAEIGRRFGASTSLLCDTETIEGAILRAKKPLKLADIYRHPESNEWTLDMEINEGAITFWCELNAIINHKGQTTGWKPPLGDYAIGADIAAGTGGSSSSYSCLEVFDRRTGENVAEWRSNRMNTIEFTSLTVWLCRLFYGALLIPEANGIGAQFLDRLKDLRYGHVYMRRNRNKAWTEVTEVPGYWHQDGGRAILEGLQQGIKSGAAKVNSVLGLREMTRYLLKEDKVYHASSTTDEDIGARGKAHGDAAIALGCGWLGVAELPIPTEEKVIAETPQNCFMARRLDYEKKQRMSKNRSYWQTSVR